MTNGIRNLEKEVGFHLTEQQASQELPTLPSPRGEM